MTDVAVPARIPLVVIPGVQLVEVGEEWPASTGPWTVTPEDIAAAVAAQDDPAVRSPIIRLGHVRQGQPAFGRFTNLRAENNGMTLVGDLVGAPSWMADLLPYAFPSRSVEATINQTTGTGRTHACRIDAVALLGVELPAISTLDEVAAVYSAESMEQAGVVLSATIAAARGEAMPPVQIAAALTSEDVRRAYYDALGPGQDWWWIREMQLDPLALIVDDDQGGLWRVGVTITGDAVTFAQPEAVRVEYVPSAADAGVAASSAGSAPPRAIFFADRASSRGGLTVPDLTALRERLGLAADVSDEDVLAAALAGIPDPSAAPTSGDGTGDSGAGGAGTGTPVPAAVPVAASAAGQVPPGFRLVSDAVWQQVEAGAAQGAQAAQTLARQAEDAFVVRHRNRIGAVENPHTPLAEAEVRRWFQADPVKAEADVLKLPPIVHTVAAGHEAPGDETADASWDAWERQVFAGVNDVRSQPGGK